MNLKSCIFIRNINPLLEMSVGNQTTGECKNTYKEEMQGKSIMTLVLGAEYFIL